MSVSPKLVGNAVDNSRGKVQNVVIDGFREASYPCLLTACSCKLTDPILVYSLEK